MSQYPVRTGPIINDAAPFGPEMVAGWAPVAPRLFLAPRIPLPLTTTAADIPAPFTPDMVAGWHPDTPARLFVIPKVGWQTSQTTPIAAPFSPEMSAGWHPDRKSVV